MKSEGARCLQAPAARERDVLPVAGREVIASRNRGSRRGRGFPRGEPQHTFMQEYT